MSQTQRAQTTQLAPPRKTFQVESLLSGHIDVLSLLHYLHEKQGTGIRDLLINMLYDLTPTEIDSILPQLLHLWVRWESQQALYLTEFFLYQCARSLHFTLKIMWILHAEESHAPVGSRARTRIGQMLKLAEMTHVNAELPRVGATKARPQQPGSSAAARARLAGALKRSATQNSLPAPNGAARGGAHAPMARSATANGARPLVAPGARGPQGPARPTSASPLPARPTRLVSVFITPAVAGSPVDALVTVRVQAAVAVRAQPPGMLHPSHLAMPRARAATTAPNSATGAAPRRNDAAALLARQNGNGLRGGLNGGSFSASPPAHAGHHLPVTRPSFRDDTRASSPAQIRSPSSEQSTLQGQRYASPNSTASGDALASPVAATAAAHSNTGVTQSASPELDVDWPEADQDMVVSPPSASTLTSPPPSRSPRASVGGAVGDEPVLFRLLSKQVRSEYFNLQLLLFATFHDLSEALAKLVVTERNKVLREQLRAIDESIIRGLYIPLIPHTPTTENVNAGRHYRILRLLTDECWSLASRDKAPFLMHIEIEYLVPADGSMITCFDDNTYTAYKSDDEIMRDALLVSAREAAVAAAEAGQAVAVVSDHPGEANQAARTTAAQIAHLAADASTQPDLPPQTEEQAAVLDRAGSGHSGAATPTPSTPVPTPNTSVAAPESVCGIVKSTRHVPQANPFRPRRSATYQTGPTLCDQDFSVLSKAFGESFKAKKQRVRVNSPFAATVPMPRWDIISFIFKGGDDLRQEVLAMQFINTFERIFRAAKLPLFLQLYSVVITSPDSGLIETIPDAVSIDSLKKRLFPHWTCLTDFFAAYFGGAELGGIIEGPDAFLQRHPCDFGLVTYPMALRNFVESMAGYSVACYIMQVKDRHNGNIMIDRAGHIIHIDFGFMLSNSPGGNFGWEKAPFKLTQEYLDVMGGVQSDLFAYFRMLVIRGFLEARAHVDEFIVLCDIHARSSRMPCFGGPAALTSPNGVIDQMRARFAMHLQSEAEVEKFIDQLIDESIDNSRSRSYDKFQKLVSGIL